MRTPGRRPVSIVLLQKPSVIAIQNAVADVHNATSTALILGTKPKLRPLLPTALDRAGTAPPSTPSVVESHRLDRHLGIRVTTPTDKHQ